ncbi:MAG: asparaginase [Candidatus Magasanikbacteria bacterium]
MKKILVLFCGGTIAMHKSKTTGALDVQNKQISDWLLKLEPRLADIAKITTEFIDNIDSTNITHVLWEKLVQKINDNYTRYDGFLITMGTNTLAYASSALSFALLKIGKPVVLTGAQIPAEGISSDAHNNLVNGVRVASMKLGGVFVVFGSKIILGCRAKKISESDLDAFKTFNNRDFGEISIGIKINDNNHLGHTKKFTPKNGFDDNVVCLTLIPGLKNEHIIGIINNGVRGLVIRAYGSGDIPYDLLPSLEYARNKKVPVVVTTQCPGGATIMGLNDVGLKALHTGVIQAFDMSMETMSTKLMWLLKQKTPYEKIQIKMHENMCGEVDINRAKVFLN